MVTLSYLEISSLNPPNSLYFYATIIWLGLITFPRQIDVPVMVHIDSH